MKGAPEVIEAVWSDLATEVQAIELGEACRLGHGKDLRGRIEVGLLLRTSVPQIGEIPIVGAPECKCAEPAI